METPPPIKCVKYARNECRPARYSSYQEWRFDQITTKNKNRKSLYILFGPKLKMHLIWAVRYLPFTWISTNCDKSLWQRDATSSTVKYIFISLYIIYSYLSRKWNGLKVLPLIRFEIVGFHNYHREHQPCSRWYWIHHWQRIGLIILMSMKLISALFRYSAFTSPMQSCFRWKGSTSSRKNWNRENVIKKQIYLRIEENDNDFVRLWISSLLGCAAINLRISETNFERFSSITSTQLVMKVKTSSSVILNSPRFKCLVWDVLTSPSMFNFSDDGSWSNCMAQILKTRCHEFSREYVIRVGFRQYLIKKNLRSIRCSKNGRWSLLYPIIPF